MELHEAIMQLKRYQGYLPISEQEGARKHAFDLNDETVDTILIALSHAKPSASRAADISFEDYLTARNDEIDQTAFALLCALSGSQLVWDMEKIGALVDAAEALLAERGVATCRPFYEGEDETPCISGKDCGNHLCAFRVKREEAG